MLSKMARLLGREGDWIYLDDLAQYIRSAFNKEFFNPETSVYSTGSQTAYSMPLFFGITEDSCRKKVVENLISSIRANNNSLTAGDIGYRYLLRVLEQEGQSQLIFEMNSKTDVPGYGFQLAKGATSLTESWAGLTEVSNNHMMLGHLMEWFFSGLAGIRQADGSQAYKDLVISPEPVGDIKWVQASYKSGYGLIEVHWSIKAERFELAVSVPVGCKATVLLPTGDPSSAKENLGDSVVQPAGIINGKAGFNIQSGKYLFTCEMK
jgi:hypothetical protein